MSGLPYGPATRAPATRETAMQRAQSDIATALAELEITTGQVVRSVEVVSIDVTKYTDARQQLLRSINIDLYPIPGSQWQT